MGPLVAPAGRGLREDGGGRVPPRLDQHRLGQLEVEVGGGLGRLIRHMGGVALRATPLVPVAPRGEMCVLTLAVFR